MNMKVPNLDEVNYAMEYRIPITKKARCADLVSNFFRHVLSVFGIKTYETHLTNALISGDNARVVKIIKSGFSVEKDYMVDEKMAQHIVKAANEKGISILLKQGLNEESRVNLLLESLNILTNDPANKEAALAIFSSRLSDLENNPLTANERKIVSHFILHFNQEMEDFDIEGIAIESDPELLEKMVEDAKEIILSGNSHQESFAMDFLEARLSMENPLTRREARAIGQVYAKYLEWSVDLFANGENTKVGIKRVQAMQGLLPQSSLVGNFALIALLNIKDLSVISIEKERGSFDLDEFYFKLIEKVLQDCDSDDIETLEEIRKTLDGFLIDKAVNMRAPGNRVAIVGMLNRMLGM